MFGLFKKKPKKPSILNSSVDSPEKLDQLWLGYEETGNPEFVRKIVSTLDGEDKVRTLMEKWFINVSAREFEEYLPKLADWMFPLQPESRTIDSPLDLDIHVALLAKAGKLKFKDLPVEVPQKDLVRLAIKSAALWSLVSMSRQNEEVSKICKVESKVRGGAARLHLAGNSC